MLFSVLKHSRFGWHLRKLSVFVFKCKANAKKQPPWQMTTCPEAHSNPPRHLGFYFSLHTVLCYQTGRLTDFHFWQKNKPAQHASMTRHIFQTVIMGPMVSMSGSSGLLSIWLLWATTATVNEPSIQVYDIDCIFPWLDIWLCYHRIAPTS